MVGVAGKWVDARVLCEARRSWADAAPVVRVRPSSVGPNPAMSWATPLGLTCPTRVCRPGPRRRALFQALDAALVQAQPEVLRLASAQGLRPLPGWRAHEADAHRGHDGV